MPIGRTPNRIVAQTDTGAAYKAPTDSSVDPYGVQQSGETGAVTPQVATIINPSVLSGGGRAIPTATPDTGLPNEAPTGIEGVGGSGVTPVQYSNVTQNLANIASDMDNANANPEAQGIPNATDPYGVQQSGDAMYGVPIRQDLLHPEQQTSGATGGGYSTGTYGGGSAGTGGTGGGGTGGTATGGGTGGTGQQTQGDVYFNQAATMKFEWNPDEDPGYNVAWQQAQRQITSAMVGRGALWSSVNQNALTAKNFELQALFYDKAYDKFRDERAFIMQLANMSYDREDEAWSRNMQMLKFNADREDAAFSKAMQQKNLDLSYAKFEYDKKMQEESMNLAKAQQYVSTQTAAYSQKASLYEKYYKQWAEDGLANNQVAAYFGVRPNTSITALSAKNAIESVYGKLTAQQAQIATYAENTNSYGAYLDSMNEYMTMTSTANTGTSAPTIQETATFNALKGKLYSYSDASSFKTGFYDTLSSEAINYVNTIGIANYNALVALADKELQRLNSKDS